MKKIGYNEVYNFFKSKGYTLLDEVYKNNNTKMTCLNSDGYKLFVSYDNLRSGRNPRIFHVSNPYTIENMNLYLKKNNYQIELLTEEYDKLKSDMLFRCTNEVEEFYKIGLTKNNVETRFNCKKRCRIITKKCILLVEISIILYI